MSLMVPGRREPIRHRILAILAPALLLLSCATARAEVHWNVYVAATSAYTDQIGPQIVSYLKQDIAGSVSLRLSNQAAGSQFVISIVTVDEGAVSQLLSAGSRAAVSVQRRPGAARAPRAPATASAFSVLILGGLGGKMLLLDQLAGTCTAENAQLCAEAVSAHLTLAISRQMSR